VDFIIQPEYNKKTVKEFLRREINPSRKLLILAKNRENGITVNGKRVTVRYMMSCGDILSFNYEDYNETDDCDSQEHIAGNPDLLKSVDILYEDEYILAVNKPYNMPSHPSINHHGDTLANAVMAYFSQRGVKSFFRAVNRLDKNTSGIVLIAKDKMTSARLNGMIKHGEIKKTYIAVVLGDLNKLTDTGLRNINSRLSEINGTFEYDFADKTGKITAPIKRGQDSIIKRVCASDGDYSETDFKALKSNGDISVLEIYPKTGRTHQIRVHFSTIGFPIVGDDLYFCGDNYNINPKYGITRHALHAASLEFDHPILRERVNIFCEVCGDIKNIIDMA